MALSLDLDLEMKWPIVEVILKKEREQGSDRSLGR